MRDLIFLLRTIILSVEFLLIFFGFITYLFLYEEILRIILHIGIEQINITLTMPLPLAIFAFFIKNAVAILHQDTPYSQILLRWPNYKYLKLTYYVALFYSSISLLICFISALFKLGTPESFLSFIVGLLVLSSSTLSCYIARIEIKDYLTTFSE